MIFLTKTTSAATLYSKIIAEPKKLRWKDIFLGGKTKHSQGDTDYAMIAGTSLDTVSTPIGMLQKWQRPWLYLRALAAGLILTAILLGAASLSILVYGVSLSPALNLLMILIPPCVVPITLMIFFWELNAPRDISLTAMIGYFFIGGILSILTTTLLYLVIPTEAMRSAAIYAPITEEPAKLLISLFLLRRLYKRKGMVYGFSGLALGAAVGAGFAAFESAQYAYNQLPWGYVTSGIQAIVIYLTPEILGAVLLCILIRSISVICTHVLYCAPYACIAALNMEGNGQIWRGLCSLSFWVLFLVSCLCHGLWNKLSLSFSWWKLGIRIVIFTAILWSTALYGVHRSFAQLTGKIQRASTSGAVTQRMLQGIRGHHAGVVFALSRPEVLIGSDPSCQLNYPVSLPDIAPIHGKLIVRNGDVYLAALGSQGGITLNGVRLKPMTGYLVNPGDRIELGSSGQEFLVI